MQQIGNRARFRQAAFQKRHGLSEIAGQTHRIITNVGAIAPTRIVTPSGDYPRQLIGQAKESGIEFLALCKLQNNGTDMLHLPSSILDWDVASIPMPRRVSCGQLGL